MQNKYVLGLSPEKIVDVTLRVRDFYHQAFEDDSACLVVDDGQEILKNGEPMFHLAYQMPVREPEKEP